jgi:hypothetical protein
MDPKTSQKTLKMDESALVNTSRRTALVRLGLGVGAAYIAPTLLRLDRSAEAMGSSCRGKRKKWCN